MAAEKLTKEEIRDRIRDLKDGEVLVIRYPSRDRDGAGKGVESHDAGVQ